MNHDWSAFIQFACFYAECTQCIGRIFHRKPFIYCFVSK